MNQGGSSDFPADAGPYPNIVAAALSQLGVTDLADAVYLMPIKDFEEFAKDQIASAKERLEAIKFWRRARAASQVQAAKAVATAVKASARVGVTDGFVSERGVSSRTPTLASATKRRTRLPDVGPKHE